MLKPFVRASDYVPADLNATDWSQLRPLYQGLVDRELHCSNCLERLIYDRSELDAAVSEAGSVLYINMTCHTEDEGIKRAYLAFVEDVQPLLKEISFQLDRKIVSAPMSNDLDPARFAILLSDTKAAVDLFRPENIPL
jgi:oligoendopeptidase F